MSTKVRRGAATQGRPGYRDFRQHVAALAQAGLLHKVDRPVNKDTQMHPLVRWQYRGGVPETMRKAFLFDQVVDSHNREYAIPVVVGALSATREIYAVGMDVPVDQIGAAWDHAMTNPIPPIEVAEAPCQENVILVSEDAKAGEGLDLLPVPISSPGFDSAPYLTATGFVTKDPDTGVQNMGTYRCGLKAPNRMAVRMSPRSGGRDHWFKWKARGEPMPVAIELGSPPLVAYCAPQNFTMGVDEMAVAGGAAGEPIRTVRCRTVDLTVSAEAEIVIEGFVDTTYLEPEGPYGESHGYVVQEAFNHSMTVTAITHRNDAVFPSIISQVTPSESSIVKRVAMEPRFLRHLREELGIRAVTNVILHEPLTNVRPVVFVQFSRSVNRFDVWRALHAAAAFMSGCGKYVIGLNEDIDPNSGDFLLWALAYRTNPMLDVKIYGDRQPGQGPKVDFGGDVDSTMLIDATMKGDMPPLSLPKRAYMEDARILWQQLNLPALTPEPPWFGYSLGDWTDRWDLMAERAAKGNYAQNGAVSFQQRRTDVPIGLDTRKVLDPD